MTSMERRINTVLGYDLVLDFYQSIEKCRGELDCINGNPAKSNQSQAYEDGYGKRFNLEQNATHWSEQQ